jgi:periplasmic protein TonB
MGRYFRNLFVRHAIRRNRMFTNLIESTSHAKEFKRRGSFLLFTTATYVVLFVITGVVSIYAYDARLEQQNLEVVALLSPQDLVPVIEPEVTTDPQRPQATREPNNSNVTERVDPMLSVNVPQKPPEGVSTAPNTNPPIPASGVWFKGNENRNAGLPSGPGSSTSGQVAASRQVVPTTEEPPPPLADPPKPKIISKGVITSQALSLPKPAYPPLAKQAGIQGTVSVQVLIDESGRVISAKAISGSPFLTAEAQKAALLAKFSPTLLGDQPVKVSGVITYNFILGR